MYRDGRIFVNGTIAEIRIEVNPDTDNNFFNGKEFINNIKFENIQ